MFDMDGTLIDLEKKPKYTGLENKHKPFLSLKAQMKKIAAENGVPAEVVAPVAHRFAHALRPGH